MALAAFGDSKIMNGQVTLWQVVAAYVFALAGGSISTSLHLGHKPLCALISFAAGTLLNPIFNMQCNRPAPIYRTLSS